MEGRVALSELENTVHVPSVDSADARERDIERILITEQQIQDKLRELGEQITRDYEGRELLLLGVLKGAFIFLADLMREVGGDVSCDFIAVSSYAGTTSTGPGASPSRPSGCPTTTRAPRRRWRCSGSGTTSASWR